MHCFGMTKNSRIIKSCIVLVWLKIVELLKVVLFILKIEWLKVVLFILKIEWLKVVLFILNNRMIKSCLLLSEHPTSGYLIIECSEASRNPLEFTSVENLN